MANKRKKQVEKPTPRNNKKEIHLQKKEAEQQRKLIIGIGIAAAVIVLILIVGLVDAYIITPNKAIAQFDDEKITVKDFQTQARYTRWQLLTQYNQISNILSYFGDYDGNQQNQLNQIAGLLSSTELLGEEVINIMIEDIIIAKKAEELGISIDEQELEILLQEAFGFYLDGTPTAIPTPTEILLPTLNATQEIWITPTPPAEEIAESEAATVEETEDEVVEEEAPESVPTPTVAPTATPYTFELYEENYVNYLNDIKLANIKENDFRKFMIANELRVKVFEALTSDILTEEEMVWARHILTPDEVGALSVRGQIVTGSIHFEEMAIMLSIDTLSAEKGGDLGWFARGMMVGEFEEAAFSLEIGEISEPMKSDFGYHIIQVLGKDVRPITESQLSSKKNAAFAEWLEEERAAVDGSLIVNEELRSQFAPAEPSFNDPKIYEVFFGINPYDAQRTQEAYATQEAETFSIEGTEVPAEEAE